MSHGSPVPGVVLTVIENGWPTGTTVGLAPTPQLALPSSFWMAFSASARPAPKMVSRPGVPRSTAVSRSAWRSIGVNSGSRYAGFDWIASAATAAAWGAAAEVPKNGLSPLLGERVVWTPSLPVRSGWGRTWNVGKSSRLSPSELNGSWVVGSLAGDAATARVSGTPG